jgi:hypothetical protein
MLRRPSCTGGWTLEVRRLVRSSSKDFPVKGMVQCMCTQRRMLEESGMEQCQGLRLEV